MASVTPRYLLRSLQQTSRVARRLPATQAATYTRSFCRHFTQTASKTPLSTGNLVPTLRHFRTYTSTTTKSTSFADETRPDLYYHLLEPPTHLSKDVPIYAVSFLSEPPVSSKSATIVGWLPAVESSESGSAGLNDFKENASFREILHKAIQSALRDQLDEIQQNGALQLQQGWMHINDDRNIPPLNRIGDPDDILASVLVEDSKIIVDTYQPMPSYRICTSDGLTKLTPGLAQRLQELLHQRHTLEKQQVI